MEKGGSAVSLRQVIPPNRAKGNKEMRWHERQVRGAHFVNRQAKAVNVMGGHYSLMSISVFTQDCVAGSVQSWVLELISPVYDHLTERGKHEKEERRRKCWSSSNVISEGDRICLNQLKETHNTHFPTLCHQWCWHTHCQLPPVGMDYITHQNIIQLLCDTQPGFNRIILVISKLTNCDFSFDTRVNVHQSVL